VSAPTPEVDVANAIATALSLNVGTDIKHGPKTSPEDSGAFIWVTPTGGPPMEPFLGASQSGSLYRPSLQVMVAGAQGDFPGGLATARQVRDALHCKAPSAAALASYRSCLVRESDPRYVGVDEAKQPLFVVNVDLVRSYLAS
jgi:hypothetical protein